VKEDIVYFSTDETKVETSPSCMAAENSDKWSLSLNTPSGKAIYALLVTASADNRKVTVESASDCADMTSFERAISVELSSESSNFSAGSKSLYLYKADGVTKAGRIVSALQLNQFWYLPLNSSNETSLQHYVPNTGTSLYFQSTNCSGEAFTHSSSLKSRQPFYLAGRFFQALPSEIGRGMNSQLNNNGSCSAKTPNGNNYYKLDFSYHDPLCGDNICLVKEG
jgi:hypothetical protein